MKYSDLKTHCSKRFGSIITDGLLHPVFQPILDFRARAYLGYEALIRGPANSPLHRPDQLFAAARQAGFGT
jgi:EAL domain-containing protein (putative c-di-GMP-specific phosphodiesterase class I)